MSAHSFSREMGFTREEFDRILPAALDDRPFKSEGGNVTLAVASGTMTLDISEQKYRKIASISLPYLEISFSFENMDESEIAETMRYFDLRYQRGGG